MSLLAIGTFSTPATPPEQQVPATLPAQTVAVVSSSIKNHEIVKSAILPEPTPSFDKEVLEPLKKAQAQKAEEERIAVQKAHIASEQAKMYDNAEAFARLRQCESGGNYATNTGNGYYGAYQFDISTWGGFGGYTFPSDAPPSVQDDKARQTQAARGWSPWPSCSAPLNLDEQGETPAVPAATPVPTPVAIPAPVAQVTKGGLSNTPNAYVWGQCTWYVKNKRPDVGSYWGNASSWPASAQAAGYNTGSQPTVGAIGVSGNHVVYIEAVNQDGTVSVSEMNWNGGVGVVNNRIAPASSFTYIY